MGLLNYSDSDNNETLTYGGDKNNGTYSFFQAVAQQELDQFCTAECFAVLPQFAIDINSTECASSIPAFGDGHITAQDLGVLVEFMGTFACLKDGPDYCIVKDFEAISNAISPPDYSTSNDNSTSYDNSTSNYTEPSNECTSCASLQILSLTGFISNFSEAGQAVISAALN